MFASFSGVVLISYAVASAASFGLSADSIPPHIFAPTQTVEKVYKENGRVVADSILSYREAVAACPNGAQTVRQESRQEGNREYLTWTLRCRSTPSPYARAGQ